MRKNNIKRIFLSVLVLVVLFTLSGCSAKSNYDRMLQEVMSVEGKITFSVDASEKAEGEDIQRSVYYDVEAGTINFSQERMFKDEPTKEKQTEIRWNGKTADIYLIYYKDGQKVYNGFLATDIINSYVEDGRVEAFDPAMSEAELAMVQDTLMQMNKHWLKAYNYGFSK